MITRELKPMEPLSRIATALLCFALFCAAATAQAENSLDAVRIQSLLEFNAILITEVDVVFVYDQAIAEQLPATKGEWYARKYDLLQNDVAGLEVVTTSIPQGFDSAFVILPERSRDAVNIFAVGYHEGQDIPIHDLTGLENALIQIDQFGIRVSGQ